MVQGMLPAQVEAPHAPHRFCIRLTNLLNCFKNVSPQHFFDMWMMRGSSDLYVCAFEPNVHTFMPKFIIKTLNQESDYNQFTPLVYDLYIEMDLACFRNAVKTAKDHKVDALEISVYVPNKDA
jgi:hypothetical protein